MMAARTIIADILLTHCRAATAGAINNALINNAPTMGNPSAIITLINSINTISTTNAGKPRTANHA